MTRTQGVWVEWEAGNKGEGKVGGGIIRKKELRGKGGRDIPFSFPSMKIKTDCKPNRLRKYHDSDDTHWTSRSRVATPDCSIDLNRRVSGKGSLTVTVLAPFPAPCLTFPKILGPTTNDIALLPDK